MKIGERARLMVLNAVLIAGVFFGAPLLADGAQDASWTATWHGSTMDVDTDVMVHFLDELSFANGVLRNTRTLVGATGTETMVIRALDIGCVSESGYDRATETYAVYVIGTGPGKVHVEGLSDSFNNFVLVFKDRRTAESILNRILAIAPSSASKPKPPNECPLLPGD